MRFEPLLPVQAAVERGELPSRVFRRIRGKERELGLAIDRIERASGIPYPPYYVEPSITVATGADMGVSLLYCRTLPLADEQGLSILVSMSAPFLLYASRGTLQAVLAHELLHYLEFVRRFSSLRLENLPSASTSFEAPFADMGAALPAHLVFKDKGLVRLIARKFRPYLVDEALAKKVWTLWVEKGYPVRRIQMAENYLRIPVASILRASFDQKVLNLLSRIYS